jgi:phosphatidylglycerophosphate synthase
MLERLTDLPTALLKSGWALRLVNLITLYRIVTAPLLLFLAITKQFELFKWLLTASFLTDALDGQLARRFKATSILGAKLDSLGDDLTILVGVVGLFIGKFYFIHEQAWVFVLLFALFLIQLGYALWKYKKMTSFHTYLAKMAAIMQGVFLCSMFFFNTPWYFFFYATALVIALELIEEMLLVYVLDEWKSDIKGIYWVMKEKTSPVTDNR